MRKEKEQEQENEMEEEEEKEYEKKKIKEKWKWKKKEIIGECRTTAECISMLLGLVNKTSWSPVYADVVTSTFV